jgi:uncharacterized SAM-binding protein YcdF (DUF218 family)
LLLFDFRPVSGGLAGGLESRYPAPLAVDDLAKADRGPIKWVVVLGAGRFPDESLPPNLQLDPLSLARLVEGLRIHRGLPRSKLVVSGGRSGSVLSQAEIMAKVAEQMGVDPKDIVLEGGSFDTDDEARLVKEIVGDDRFILVTSALHLPRSMALFEKRGMKPVPAPADRWYLQSRSVGFWDFMPNMLRLDISDRAVHEYLGLFWGKMRGTI